MKLNNNRYGQVRVVAQNSDDTITVHLLENNTYLRKTPGEILADKQLLERLPAEQVAMVGFMAGMIVAERE